MAIYGDEKHNEGMEHIQKTFTVTLTFECLVAEDPLEAAKKALENIKNSAEDFIYEVTNELTNEKFTVDLSENDEDAVLPA